jgi:hypothetical protein
VKLYKEKEKKVKVDKSNKEKKTGAEHKKAEIPPNEGDCANSEGQGGRERVLA